MEQGCIFCAIAAGEMDAFVVYEDETTIAFMDINPAVRGHTLVVPRRHARDLLTIDPQDLESVYATAKLIASRMQERLDAEEITVFHSTGTAAGQHVMHFHVHVIPARLDSRLGAEKTLASLSELNATADLLRAGD
jgi:histidine triad (HIT) family protein